MSGDFFTGLAQGFFDSRRQAEMDQRQQDERRRQEGIGVLSNLMDQVDPRSRNLLLGQIGDLMGLKGKERGFWDTLTGRAQFDLQEQIAGKLKETFGMVKGPEEYEEMRKMAQGPDLTGMSNANPSPVRQAKEALPRTIGLRDPRVEKREDFEYQKMLMQEQAKERQRLAAEARQDDIKLKADLKEKEDQSILTNAVMNRARINAWKRMKAEDPAMTLLPNQIDSAFVSKADWEEATNSVVSGLNLDEETKKTRLQVLKAQETMMIGGNVAIDPNTFRTTATGPVKSKGDVAILNTGVRLQQAEQRLKLDQQKLRLAAESLAKQGGAQKVGRLNDLGGKFIKSKTAYEQAGRNLVSVIAQKKPDLSPQLTAEGIRITTTEGKTRLLTPTDLGSLQYLLKDQLNSYMKALPDYKGARTTLQANFPDELKKLEEQ